MKVKNRMRRKMTGRGPFKNVRGREVEARRCASSVRKKKEKEIKLRTKLKAESADPDFISGTDL